MGVKKFDSVTVSATASVRMAVSEWLYALKVDIALTFLQ